MRINLFLITILLSFNRLNANSNYFIYNTNTSDEVYYKNNCKITNWIGKTFIKPSVLQINCENSDYNFKGIAKYLLHVHKIDNKGSLIVNNISIKVRDKLELNPGTEFNISVNNSIVSIVYDYADNEISIIDEIVSSNYKKRSKFYNFSEIVSTKDTNIKKSKNGDCTNDIAGATDYFVDGHSVIYNNLHNSCVQCHRHIAGELYIPLKTEKYNSNNSILFLESDGLYEIIPGEAMYTYPNNLYIEYFNVAKGSELYFSLHNLNIYNNSTFPEFYYEYDEEDCKPFLENMFYTYSKKLYMYY